jgi:lipoprotein-releasing system ATP-binding protein
MSWFYLPFHQLLPELYALENVCIPAFIANKSKQETETEAKIIGFGIITQAEP